MGLGSGGWGYGAVLGMFDHTGLHIMRSGALVYVHMCWVSMPLMAVYISSQSTPLVQASQLLYNFNMQWCKLIYTHSQDKKSSMGSDLSAWDVLAGGPVGVEPGTQGRGKAWSYWHRACILLRCL